MKKLFFILLFFPFVSFGQTFELTNGQSMIMIGKGKGQDGTINPYANEDYSFAIVENVGFIDFSIRVQEKGKIIKEILIKPEETKKVKLAKGSELYLDSTTRNKSIARVSYSKEHKPKP